MNTAVPATDALVPQSGTRTDAEIARSARIALQLTPYLVKDSVKASTRHGWITLSGEVEWEHQRQTAASLVRDLAGVTGVRNEIKVSPLAARLIASPEIEAARTRYAQQEALRIAAPTRKP